MQGTNILLDALPDNYEGYLIRTDFRVAIQIALIFADEELSDIEKAGTALRLLYGNGRPSDIKLAFEGVRWFMRGGELPAAHGESDEDDGNDDEDGEMFSFEYDADRIFSAFRKAYGVNLNTASYHWFEFRALLADVGECAFTTVIGYRTKDTVDLPPKQRAKYEKMKSKYKLPRHFSDEEQKKIADFFSALNAN